MKKIIAALMVVTLFFSCEETQNVIYDGSQTFVGFSTPTSNLDVVIDESSSIEVTVTSSTLSSADRSVEISVSESSTADAENYVVPTSVVIPANEHFGTFTIQGIDNSLDITTQTIVLNLSGSLAATNLSAESHTVRIKQICPVPDTFFVGDYLIEEISPVSATNGSALSNNSVVEVYIPNNADGNPISTQRAFETEAFPMFCPGTLFQFEIDLVCNELVVPLGRTTCSCGGNFDDYWGPAPVSTTYDVADDSVIEVNFTDDTQDACGGGTSVVTYRFTKQN